ncbi:MAG: TFIIB-type zinc finger domain-containing protein [Actinomycetota bacterium]
MDPCRVCGARLFDGATFCARCHAPVNASDAEVSELMREVDAAGGRWQEPATPAPRWQPDARHTAPPPPLIESRTRKSVLTFGLGGRIAITVAVVAVVLWAFLLSPSPASGLVLIVPSAWVLKDTWKKARIRIR